MNNFDLRKFLTENKLTSKSLNERNSDHGFYDDQEQADIIKEIARDAINLIDEQPDTTAIDALEAVIEVYKEEHDL